MSHPHQSRPYRVSLFLRTDARGAYGWMQGVVELFATEPEARAFAAELVTTTHPARLKSVEITCATDFPPGSKWDWGWKPVATFRPPKIKVKAQ